MSKTYSTLQREATGGRIYSSRQSQVTILPAGSGPSGNRVVASPVAAVATPVPQQPAPAHVPVPAHVPAAAQRQYTLSAHGQQAAAQVGPEANGWVRLSGNTVMAEVTGIKPLRDPAVVPTLWLISDLTVPHDLAPQDLAALPRGAAGTGNQPGTVYTLDGNPATYDQKSKTLSISVSPGTLTAQPDSSWRASGALDNRTNQAYHPLVVLGPTVMADMNATLPSGTVARILTDVFMRPATVHPDLNLRTQFGQRLLAVTRDVLALGTVDFLDPARFGRAAVTLEGPVRTTPRLMPSPNTCFLMALRPE